MDQKEKWHIRASLATLRLKKNLATRGERFWGRCPGKRNGVPVYDYRLECAKHLRGCQARLERLEKVKDDKTHIKITSLKKEIARLSRVVDGRPNEVIKERRQRREVVTMSFVSVGAWL